MLQVKRAGHSTLTTPDIGRMVDYFTRIVGLSLVARDKDRAQTWCFAGVAAFECRLLPGPIWWRGSRAAIASRSLPGAI